MHFFEWETSMRAIFLPRSLFSPMRTVVFLFAFSLFCGTALSEDASYGTGLLPPSPAQAAWERENVRVSRRTLLNALGAQRVAEAMGAPGQSRSGLSFGPLADVGQEVIEYIPLGEALEWGDRLPPALLPSNLPPSVDNSTLKYFPPIRSQGGTGSCAQWAYVYYALTHMTAMAREWDVKNGGNAFIMSPKFTYNVMNDGVNSGSPGGWYLPKIHGCATWAEWPWDGDYREWPTDAAIWRSALNNRPGINAGIMNVDTPAGLAEAKVQLVNGYVLAFGIYINSAQWTLIGNDPHTSEDDALAGKSICHWVNGTNGGHAMTIVGYNDTVWTDINGNGLVEAGEKGAFRVANSWGTGWKDSGFCWISFDALKAISAVPGAPSSGRLPAFHSSYVASITGSTSYTPMVLAEFTLSHKKRNQLKVWLGTSTVSATTPATLWPTQSMLFPVFDFWGGAYAFDGSETATDIHFVMDFSALAPSDGGARRWYLKLTDNTSGDPTTLKNFTVKNNLNGFQVSHGGLPLAADNSSITPFVEMSLLDGGNDSTAPELTLNAPTAGSLVSGIVLVSATASDDRGVSRVEFTVDNGTPIPDASVPYQITWNTVATSSGPHTLSVKAYDAAGNFTTRTVSVTVLDVTAPSVPGRPTGTTSNDSVFLSWTPSVDLGSGIREYRVYRDMVRLTETFTPSFTDVGLTVGSTVTYTVTAIDKAGLESAPSPSRSVWVSGQDPADTGIETIGFPNPARGGVVPTVRVLVGQDAQEYSSFEVSIYDRGGSVVHHADVTALPGYRSDGRAYFDYPWQGLIASGRYHVVVKARKSGGGTVRSRSVLTVLR
jgi:hypothetical protein